MVKIVELLDSKAEQEFDNLIYEDGGLMELLPAGLTFSDEALEFMNTFFPEWGYKKALE